MQAKLQAKLQIRSSRTPVTSSEEEEEKEVVEEEEEDVMSDAGSNISSLSQRRSTKVEPFMSSAAAMKRSRTQEGTLASTSFDIVEFF